MASKEGQGRLTRPALAALTPPKGLAKVVRRREPIRRYQACSTVLGKLRDQFVLLVANLDMVGQSVEYGPFDMLFDFIQGDAGPHVGRIQLAGFESIDGVTHYKAPGGSSSERLAPGPRSCSPPNDRFDPSSHCAGNIPAG